MKVNLVKHVLVLTLMCFAGSMVAVEAQQPAPEQTWTVNFKDTDILEVVKFIGEVTGKTIVVDAKVRGPIKVISSKPLTKKELYELFLAVLDINGFTAIDSDGVVRIIANRDARNMPIPTESKVTSKDDGYITQIIQLNNISAAKVLAALRPLVPQYGHLSAYEPSNALIISDTRANISRINELILQMDKAAILATDVIPLHYAQASELVTMINQLEKPDPNRGVTTSPPIIVADKRTNAVIVSGDEMSRQRIKGVVDNLDRPQARNANAKVRYLKYAKATDVAKVITAMLQTQPKPAEGGSSTPANVQADEGTNSVLITADGDALSSIMSVVDSLDIRRAQVLVEAIIVEVSDSAGKEMGVQWMYADKTHGFGGSADGKGTLAGLGGAAMALKSTDPKVQDTGLVDLAKGLSSIPGQTFGLAHLGDNMSFFGLLKMLQTNSNTNVLSTPNLLTTDNTKASISVGQKVPFKNGSYSGATTQGSNSGSFSNPFNTIIRESVGVKLEVTPHMNEGDSLVLDIKQEVSGISDSANPDGPITDERKIDTQIIIADGQTVVLGGLIRDDVQVGATKVPVLGSIPVLGHLFRTQTSKKIKTNLLVFIRATVIRDDQVLEGATAEKYKYIRDLETDSRKKNGKVIPVLPEWKDNPAAAQGATETTPDPLPRLDTPAQPKPAKGE